MILAHFVKWLICVEVSVSHVHVGQNLQAAVRRYRGSQKRSVWPWNTDYALRMSKQTFSCALMDPHSSRTGTWLQYGAAAEPCYRLTNSTVPINDLGKKKMAVLKDFMHISLLMANDSKGTKHEFNLSVTSLTHNTAGPLTLWLEGDWQVIEHHCGQHTGGLLQPEPKGQTCPSIKSHNLQTGGRPCEQPHWLRDRADWQAAAARIMLEACGDK